MGVQIKFVEIPPRNRWRVRGTVRRMPKRSSSRPQDRKQVAELVLDVAVGEPLETALTPDGRNAAAVSLGRRGGLKGGPARAEKMTAEQRKLVATRAANARWAKVKGL